MTANPFSSILITGAQGMLAHAVCGELARRGQSFTACDARTCDITDSAAVDQAFDRYRPTVLINCAAYTNVDQAEQQPERANGVNGDALSRLATAARRHGTKLVHISTDFVFDGSKRSPYLPSDPTHPLSAYGRSKLLGEQRIREIDPPNWLIMRTAWLYGPHGRCFPRTILDAARTGKPLRVVADQVGPPTYTPDLAQMIIDLIARGAHGIYHATNAGQTTWHQFAVAVLDAFALSAQVAAISAADWQRDHPHSAPRPAFSVLDTTATDHLIRRPPRPWIECLSDFARSARPA